MLDLIRGLPPGKDADPPEDLGDIDGCNPDEYFPEEEMLRDESEREEEAEEKKWNERLMLDGEVEVTCKVIPEARSHAASVVMGNKMYIMGGFSRENKYLSDAWYRDDIIPNIVSFFAHIFLF